MGNTAPPIADRAIGKGVDFRDVDYPLTIYCPEGIGYTNIIGSCAFCSLGKARKCKALEKHGEKGGQPVHPLLYDHVLIAQKSKKMPANKKPKLVAEIDPKKPDRAKIVDLKKNPNSSIDPKLDYRPVLRRYTVKVELVTKGNKKNNQKDFPSTLVVAMTNEGDSVGALGKCRDLVAKDELCHGDVVFELGDKCEFQLKLEKLPERRRKAKASQAPATKKKKRGRPPKNDKEAPQKKKKRGRAPKNQ